MSAAAAAGDYKTILVHCDAGKTAPARLDLAFQIGAQSGAHVAVLYALTMEPERHYDYTAMQIVREAQQRVRAQMREAARGSYEESLRRSGYEKIEWRETEADALDAVALHARYADLVVIGQSNEDWPSGVGKEFARDLPLAAGRPVLVVPYAFEKKPIGRRILIAWNASREAARAASDALPLLKRASHVQVVAFRPGAPGAAHGEEPGADIGLFLARHGVHVTVSRQDAPDLDVGSQLLSRAADLSADLIVMGAWGHSRLREFILGGVTRTLLESMTVPVLMSH
jgi:nucleotide-binding universal stress UspA family protein